MTLQDLLTDTSGTAVTLDASGTAAASQYADQSSQALLFDRAELDPEFAEDELDIWLETAEEEEADDDLVLFGFHPIDEDSQVERLFYYRKSQGSSGPVYSLDVDGTAVPGTLAEFSKNLSCFSSAG